MKIESLLEKFNVDRKSFLLLTVTPKGKYPLKSYGKEFENFVANIFSKDKYIGIFNQGRPEILQDVAFKLFTMPLIGDSYRKTIKIPRSNEEKIKSFFAIKMFYQTVPHGELTEEEAIKNGIKIGEDFLQQYPIDSHEFTIIRHSRYEDGVQCLFEMEFDFSEGYYFDYVYTN
jgi:hypothetical protein